MTIEQFCLSFVIDTATGCWLWPRGKRGKYGRANLNGSDVAVHRAAYEMWCGPIPLGMDVLHSCDTPLCGFPSHLRPGTDIENMNDREARDRTARGARSGRQTCPQTTARGSRHGLAKVGESRVPAIFEMHADGMSQRSIAAALGVGKTVVGRVLRGKAWTHVMRPPAELVRPRK